MARRAAPGRIVTLTMNPAVDVSFVVDRMSPTEKLRARNVRRDPGGGGVNVARVIRRLGGRSLAVFPAGGPGGARMEAMLRAERTPHRACPIAGETREDFAAEALDTGAQYRFVLPGPRLSGAECKAACDAVFALEPTMIVVSGSLPPGAPVTLYGRIARQARAARAKMALDASGVALRHGLAAGVWLVKPNLAELAQASGAALADTGSRLAACRAIVAAGGAEIVALSMGGEGAMLVTAAAAWQAKAPAVAAVSTVGAGDSFMGALVLALASGLDHPEALRRAVAAGSAALLAPGSQLCLPADVHRLAERVCATPLC